MRVCVVSDTHGSDEYSKILVARIKGKVDLVIHLGDDSPDADFFTARGFNVIKVPGVFEQIYQISTSEKRKIEVLDGIRFLLTHTPERHRNDYPTDPGPAELSEKVNVVLYGHTHILKMSVIDNVLWLNPGHMKKGDNRGFPPSYCILDFHVDENSKKIINAAIYEVLTDKVLMKKDFIL